MGGAKYVIGSKKIKLILVHGEFEKTTPHAQLESFFLFICPSMYFFDIFVILIWYSVIRRTLRTHLSFAIAHSRCLIN